MVRLIIYATESTDSPVIYDGVFNTRKAAEVFAEANAKGSVCSYENVRENLKPTTKNIHKALW